MDSLTTDQVRGHFAASPMAPSPREFARSEFDRWLIGHDRALVSAALVAVAEGWGDSMEPIFSPAYVKQYLRELAAAERAASDDVAPAWVDPLPWVNGHGTRSATDGTEVRPSNDMAGWNCSGCIRRYEPRPAPTSQDVKS